MSNTTEFLDYAGSLAEWVFKDSENLMTYLDVMSKFSDYSVNNQLLVLGYNMNASMLKSVEDWQMLGASVRENPAYVPVIVPIEGTKDYDIKWMVDVADTNYPNQVYVPDREGKLKRLEALISGSCDIINVVDAGNNSTRAFYKPAEGKIDVLSSVKAGPDEFFNAIAREMCHMDIYTAAAAGKDETKTYHRASYMLKCSAAAYALSSKYGMDKSVGKLGSLPGRYDKLQAKNAKNELASICSLFNGLDKRMEKLTELEKGGVIHQQERGN